MTDDALINDIQIKIDILNHAIEVASKAGIDIAVGEKQIQISNRIIKQLTIKSAIKDLMKR